MARYFTLRLYFHLPLAHENTLESNLFYYYGIKIFKLVEPYNIISKSCIKLDPHVYNLTGFVLTLTIRAKVQSRNYDYYVIYFGVVHYKT